MTMQGDGDTPGLWTPRGVTSGIQTAEKADDLRALGRSVVATPPRSQADRPASPYMIWLGAQVDSFSPWGVAPKLRDRQLREFFPRENLLASALATITARNAALSWKVTGHEKTAEAGQGLLNNANFGAGWEDFISRLSLDLYTTDSGAFVELVRVEDSPDAPVFGINTLDSTRCYPTGVPEFPVIYEDTLGRMHRMPWYSVVQLLEMPSAYTPTFAGMFYRLQYCAVTRVLKAAQIMQSISTYTDEKVSGRFLRALHLISGVDEGHVQNALATAQASADVQGLQRYMMPAIVGAVDPGATIGHTIVELASLPDGFSSKEEREGYILALALGLLTDYGEFAPLPGGGLGTASQSETMNQKSRGKGSGLFQKLILRLINQHGVLPSNVEFEWDEQDLEADEKAEAVKTARASTRAARITSGEIDITVARQQALEDGDLTQQQFDELQARDAEAAQRSLLAPPTPPASSTAIEGEQKGPAADGPGAVQGEEQQQKSGVRSAVALEPEEGIQPEDYEDEGWKHTPGGEEHDQSDHGNWADDPIRRSAERTRDHEEGYEPWADQTLPLQLRSIMRAYIQHQRAQRAFTRVSNRHLRHEATDDELTQAREAQTRASNRLVGLAPESRVLFARWQDIVSGRTGNEGVNFGGDDEEGEKHDAPTLVAAGLAVVAEDTGRVLMLQRALTEGDPASGTWEFPGGHIDDDEPIDAAKREWQEETGLILPDGEVVGEWDSVNGVYRGFVYRIPAEFAIATRDGDMTNPDDPDGDHVEAIAWWDAQHLRQNSAIRQELADNLAPMYAALAMGSKEWDAREVTQERLDYEQDAADVIERGLRTALAVIRERAAVKHGDDHDEDTHGNWATGGSAAVATPAMKLRQNAIEQGGATYNVVTREELAVGTGEDGPYVVAAFPERGASIPLDEYREQGLAAMAAYVATNRDVLQNDDAQDVHFGIWVDGGRVVFDCVVVESDLGTALRIAGDNNQEAIFDAGHGVEIPTGGTGGAESGKKAEGRRLLALVPLAGLDTPEAQRALYDETIAALGDSGTKDDEPPPEPPAPPSEPEPAVAPAPRIVGSVKEVTRTATGYHVVDRPLYEGEQP